jgi:hypothetical protein
MIGFLAVNQPPFVQSQLHQGVNQLAFFLAEVFAPDDGHDLSLGDVIAVFKRPFARWMVAILVRSGADGDDLTGETRLDAAEAVRFEKQRAGQGQRSRRRCHFDGGALDPQALDHIGRQLDCIVVAGDEPRLGNVAWDGGPLLGRIEPMANVDRPDGR